MCTLSFVPDGRGYIVAMNRDERLEREIAELPQRVAAGGTWVVYPREAGDGTWIAANDSRVTLALLNWHAVEMRPPREQRTRGAVIPRLIAHNSLSALAEDIGGLDFKGMLPFRLAGIFGVENRVCEWRWDGSRLSCDSLDWDLRHWFSSSVSDDIAAKARGRVCRVAGSENDAGSLPWLRRLHRSHFGGPGPFSVCVHRTDAATVSYAEVVCRENNLVFGYVAGHPCLNRMLTTELELPLVRDLTPAV